ncbi:hypothetical protein M1105_13330 [Limibaculum sp. FT325]|uniref:hypothetical protein n=1 Tax=Thermohalobaculum sediminis TaxID=2939436 RepID=UPI0020BDDFE5|nr:hypothetical protein [Limibaculum sediminis]MCL5777965.1 hypothetical protein [Limibaculum sediminis]
MKKSDHSDITKKGFDPQWWESRAPKLFKMNKDVIQALHKIRTAFIGPNGLPNLQRAKETGFKLENVEVMYKDLIHILTRAQKECVKGVHDDTKAGLDIYLKQAKVGQMMVQAALK